MKPEVRLQITPDIYAVFNTVEEIDDLSEILASCRADLEHQIEMEKQRKRDKRTRQKNRKKVQLNENIQKTLAEYEELKQKVQEDETLAKILAPLIEMSDVFFERAKSKLK